MSFSSEVKEEVLKEFSKNKKKCCKDAEMFGEYLTEYKSKKDIREEFKDNEN